VTFVPAKSLGTTLLAYLPKTNVTYVITSLEGLETVS